jgi:hypothetical protein
MTDLAVKQHMVAKVGAAKNGVSVTFTLATPGIYDGTTDTFSSATTSTWTGTAQRVAGDAKRYAELNLVESEAPTLLFTPDTLGDTPALNSSCSFSGVVYVVRDVNPWAPDGTTRTCRVVVSR